MTDIFQSTKYEDDNNTFSKGNHGSFDALDSTPKNTVKSRHHE